MAAREAATARAAAALATQVAVADATSNRHAAWLVMHTHTRAWAHEAESHATSSCLSHGHMTRYTSSHFKTGGWH